MGSFLMASRRDRRRGIAALELAVVLPVLLTLLAGLLEVGRMIEVRQILSNAVREGGRRAATGVSTATEVRQVVLDYIRDAGLPTRNAVVTVENQTSPSSLVQNAKKGDKLRVHASIPFQDVQWINLQLVGELPSTKLSDETFWASLGGSS